MADSPWMIPKPSLAAQAQLQHSLHALRSEGPGNIDKVIDLTADLLRQNMEYKTLLNQALGHIIQLEAAAALREPLPALPEQFAT